MVDFIAERQIFGTIDGIQARALVRLWAPEHDAEEENWSCRFTFEVDLDVPALKDGRGNGIDAMQALIEALNGVGSRLDRSGIVWSMFPDDDVNLPEHDHGFPRGGLSAMFLGAAFHDDLANYVEREKIDRMKARASGRPNKSS